MAGSTISLDSLSSPSPSLSPPPESNKPAEPTSAGLNSDSELSELTEEEQEADKRDNAPRKGVKNSASHRGGRPSRRGGRRKTSSIVPAPMWGWAETRPSSNVVEEEEEEEMAGPPRAMEEEEDEEGGRDDEQEEEEEPDAKQVGTAPEEEDDLPAAEADEAESVFGDDDPTYRSRRSPRKPNPSRGASMNGILKNGDDMDVDADDNVDEASDAEALPARMNEPESEDENGNQSETEDEGDDDKDALPAADADEPATTATTPMEMDVDVDVTAPQPQDIAPLAAAAAASSIMAGSGIIDPPSPSSSQRSTPSSSRSNSPAPGTDAEDAADANAGEEKDDDDDAALVTTAADVDAAEQEGAEDDQEADDGDIDDTNPDDVDNEVESDLQPAHRAEALDVLATIELKFALLRERVYVEKMENLAWEEALVNEGTHPELLHLQRELSTRRDKRIELATRKRLLEVANVNKRRRTDEDGIWSWWKFSRDDLQTEMIAETNRKRRRMERERRVNDRHQPVRAIPPANQEYPPAQPLRKVVKSIAFSNMRTKSSKKYRPPQPVYPELSSLSEHDVAYDMECIFQTQRERSRVSMPIAGYDMPHVHRVPSAGAYPSNGPYIMGAGHVGYPSVPHSHQLGYSDGGHINSTRPYLNGVSNVDHRIPPFPQGPPPQHVHHHLPQPPPQPVMPHSHAPFAGPPGSRNIHMQQPPQHPPPAPLHSSHGHHSHAPPPHNAAPPFNSADQDISIHPHHTHNHAPPHTHGSSYYMPRRSPSPAGMGMMQNGGSSSKMGSGINGGSSWMGSGMGMEHDYTGSGPGKGTDWGRDRDRDGRSGTEEDEQERMAREMDKRERDQREREIQHRERERDEIERERHRDMHHLHHQLPQHQQMPHRHQAPQHLHLHPGAGSQSHHHMNGPHYHHRPHHHHVLHHHHQPSSGAHSGHPNSLSQGVRSPHSLQRDRERERNEREREYDNRPPHSGHNQHPTEVINLTSSKPTTSQYHDQHLTPDYRDVRSKHGAGGARTPSSSGLGSSMMIDDKDRPPPMSFALPPSHGLPPPNHGPPPGSNSLNGRITPPRNSWNTSEDNNHRGPLSHPSSGPPPGYHSVPHDSGTPHSRSPNQAHRYTNNGSSLSRGPPPPPGPPSSQQSSRHNSIGLHSPPRPTLPRAPVPPVPASPTSAPAPYPPSNANPNCSPSRFADPRSPPINIKMRPPSPPPNKMPPYAVLSGPGRTSTPTLEKNGPPGPGYSGSRSSEAMMSFQAPGRGYVGQNGTNDRDRDKERERDRERERPMLSHFGPPPPPPVPSKMSVPQMVDGH